MREFWKHQSVGRPTLPFTTIGEAGNFSRSFRAYLRISGVSVRRRDGSFVIPDIPKRILRMQFLAQLMASPDVSDEWKRRAYRELNPMGENFYIMRKEEIKTPVRLYGERALVFGNYRGLTEPYSVNKENSFDYAMAVCRPLQEAYAHSGHYRYLIARNHLKGWERIRCSFPKFAQTLDKTAFAVTGDAFDELVKADNPGGSA